MAASFPDVVFHPFACPPPRRNSGPAPVQGGEPALPDCSMAFQPIVDLTERRIIAYEALVRGIYNEPAATVLRPSTPVEYGHLDQACRLRAIQIASTLGVAETGADLCINLSPRVSGAGAAELDLTLEAAVAAGLPLSRLIFEITEDERLQDPERLKANFREHRRRGVRVAIDDFGAGFAGLSLLGAFQPDILKLDIALSREIQHRHPARVLVGAIAQLCRELDIQIIAEGIEQEEQVAPLLDLGIRYMQGHLFAPPAFEALPVWPG